jgi:hypothetical protein
MEALRIIEERPGVTVAQLREELGVGSKRIWVIVSRLQHARVRLSPVRPVE